MQPSNNFHIGIDLGTTNSLIAQFIDGKAVLIPNSLGEFLTPSAVSIDEQGVVSVGRSAWERRVTHPNLTAVAFKRAMGTSKKFRLGVRDFLPEELSALVLRALREDAEAALKQSITQAVISVPAYFSDGQRKATKAAAELAGLTVSRLINEPTAAALAYGIHQRDDESKFLIFDLGGGTFDVSIVDLFEGVVEVKASTGDNYLGGEDFTQLLAEKFAKDCSVKMQDNAHLAGRLMAAAERCKQQLSTDKSVASTLMLQDAQMPIAITEDELERIATPLLDRLRKPLERALRDARIAPAELKEVVLVGGATRMPIVRKVVTRMFGRFPNITVNPDFAIVQGAAIQAGLLASDAALDEVLLTDVCPYSMGVGVSEATQFGGQIEGVFSPIIERNTLVPVSRSKMYAPISESQTHLELQLYQGENRFVRDNILLGKLEVVLPRGKQHDRVVEVRFSYDVSGILEVDAAVLSSGKTSSVTLMGNANSLTPEEIDERRAKLALLKMHPRDEAPNKALMAKAERVYAEEMGERREAVGRTITEFASILAAQDIDKIAKHRVQLEKWLDEFDAPSLL